MGAGILHTHAHSILHTRPIAFGTGKPILIPDIPISVYMSIRIPIYSKNALMQLLVKRHRKYAGGDSSVDTNLVLF